MIRPAEARCKSDIATGIPERWFSIRLVHPPACWNPEREDVRPIPFNTVRCRARTDRPTLRRGMAQPNARRRKPQGQRGWAGDAPGKSGKKKRRALIRPHHCRIVQLQGMPCSRKS